MSPLGLLKPLFANDFYNFFCCGFFYLGGKNVTEYIINYYNKFIVIKTF